MATKPASVVSWGTDANLPVGVPEAGSSTVLEPSAGFKAAGWLPKRSVPARYLNWLFNLLGLWTTYLNDLHNSADFLNKSYTWITGTHTFSTTTNFVGIVSTSPGTAVALTVGDYGYSPARNFPTIAVPLSYAAANQATGQWYYEGGAVSNLQSTTANGIVDIPVKHLLRVGTTIKRVYLSVKRNGATGSAMSMRLYKRDLGALSAGDIAIAGLGAGAISSTTSADELLDTGVGNLSIAVEADCEYFVKVVASGAASGDIVYWCALETDVTTLQGG